MQRIGCLLWLLFAWPSFWAMAQKGNTSYWIERAELLADQKPDSALYFAQKAFDNLNQSGQDLNSPLLAKAYRLMGQLFFKRGIYDQSLQYYLESDRLFEPNTLELAINDLQIGRLKAATSHYNDALIYLKSAEEVFKKEKKYPHWAETLGEIGHIFEKKAQYDSALFFQHQALKLYTQLNDSLGQAHIHENLGSIFEDLEAYETAFEHFRLAEAINRAKGNEVERVVNLNNLGDFYRKTGNYPLAFYNTRQALNLANALNLPYQSSSALRDLGKTHALMAQHDSAYFYQEESRDLFESLFSKESSQQIAFFQALFELNRHEAQISRLLREKEYEHKLSLAFTAIGVLTLSFLVVLVNRQKLKSRQQNLLFQKQQDLQNAQLEMAQQAQESLRIELKHKALQEKHLELELESQQRVISGRLLQLIEKNRLLQDIHNLLLALPKQTETGAELEKMARKIQAGIKRDQHWDEFQASFENIYSDFFPKLQGINPDLSPSDLRLCALMKINMHSEDIATLLNISTDSLRVARHRLRKKLGIKQGDNLRKLLISIQ